MAAWHAKATELDKYLALEKEQQRSLRLELQASQAECAALEASLAQSERGATQARSELAEEREQARSAAATSRELTSVVEGLQTELAALSARRSMVHAGGSLSLALALSLSRSLSLCLSVSLIHLHAVFAKLGDEDDDVLEAYELDGLVEVHSIFWPGPRPVWQPSRLTNCVCVCVRACVRACVQNGVMMDAPGALDRLRRHLDDGSGADGQPLEGSMVIEDFIVWVRPYIVL